MAGVASSAAVRLLLRLAGVAVLAVVVATQVHVRDEVTTVAGETLRGRVERVEGGYRVEREGDAVPVLVRDARVARRGGAGGEFPAVAYGVATLASRLRGALPLVGAALTGLFLLALLTAWRWRWLVTALGLVLSAGRAVRFTLYGIFFNLFVPGSTGGDVVKAYYAAKATGSPTKATVSVFVDRAVGLFALVLLAAGLLLGLEDRPAFHRPRVIVLSVLLCAFAFVVLVLSRRVRRATGISAVARRLPFPHVWREVDAAFVLYRSRPAALALGVLVSLCNHAGTATCAYAVARALGIPEVSLGACLALVPVVSLLSAIPLLPGGWGVGEAAFALLFAPLGVAPSEAVGWSVAFRLAVLAAGIPGGILWLLARRKPSARDMRAEVDATHATHATAPAVEEVRS